MSASNIERLDTKLRSLYDEREDLKQEIELNECMGKDTLEIEEQIFELNHSITELERQLHDYEVEHLEQMKEAV
mgnify:CR=1 FL=1